MNSEAERVLSGRYRLLSLLGEGGMSRVYKAHDQELDRIVAIKVLRAQFDTGDAFRREARAAARLPHPNIITIYDVGHDADTHYIVMEYVEGKNLKEVIREEAPVQVGRALDVVAQICAAVGFAHKQDTVHCDLKPQNVLVLPSGQIKVTDFGIARAFSQAPAEEQSEIRGTPYYVSPELVSGKPLTPASDVYAIGVMLYEMLAGKPPFDGHDGMEIGRQHMLNAPPPIQYHNPRTPRYVQQLLDRALAKDPASRYRTADQLGQLVSAYREHGEAITQPLQPAPEAEAKSALEQGRTETTSLDAIPQSQRRGIDWLMVLLAGLAFVAVMGLLPLWGTVLTRVMGQALPPPTATSPAPGTTLPPPTAEIGAVTAVPSPSPTTEALAAVPDIRGSELTDARQRIEGARLKLVVLEERYDPETPASHIISQVPFDGMEVPIGTEIGVTVSLGPETIVMPDLLGFPAAVQKLELEDLGLAAVITEAWSTEPIGLIITQTPGAGTQITVGSTVTLTVSSGPRGEVGANLGDKVMLSSCEFNEVTFRPGDTVQAIITWHVLDRLPESYTVFVHVTDLSGRIITQIDRPPLGGSRPTDTWQSGEKLLDPYVLRLPSNMPPGLYWVRVGLYRGSSRLPVVDPGLARAEGDAVLVRQIEVQAN